MTHQYCPRIKNIIASWDFKPGHLAISRMRCRQWDCPYCAIKNAEIWRAHLLETFCNRLPDEKWLFITLTVPPEAHELHPFVSLKLLKAAWNKMYHVLKYANGGKLTYVLIFETHLSGIFHAHALINMGAKYDAYGVKIDHTREYDHRIEEEKRHPFCRWLSKKATDEHLGWVCHATRIKEGDNLGASKRLAVGYLSKYLSKGASEIVMPKYWRRICTSRDIGSPRSKNKSKYSWVLKPAISWQNSKAIPHWLISEGRVLGAGDFGDDGYYPPIDIS